MLRFFKECARYREEQINNIRIDAFTIIKVLHISRQTTCYGKHGTQVILRIVKAQGFHVHQGERFHLEVFRHIRTNQAAIANDAAIELF